MYVREREGGKNQRRWEVVVEDGESTHLLAAHYTLHHLWACLFLFLTACPLPAQFGHYLLLVASPLSLLLTASP